jgi:hypothetical protein
VIPSPIVEAESELRRAIERRQEGDISKCIAAYGEIAANQVKSLQQGDPIRLPILERVLRVLEWARLMIQTRRASQAEDLRLLRKVGRFLSAKPNADARFRLDL